MIEAQTSTHTPAAKRRIRGIASEAIRRGELVRQPCESCGAEKTEAHHDDYSKPLDVRWLCKPCHGRVHRGPKGGDSHPRHKTHCKNGHAMTGSNIYQTNDGRRCLECSRIRGRKASARRKITGSRT